MNAANRQEVEKKIVRAFIKSALKAGYVVSVSLERGYDIEEMRESGVLATSSLPLAMEQAFAGDECHIFVHDPETEPVSKTGQLISRGYVYFVMGNDGWDVISDYTGSLEHMLDTNGIETNLLAASNRISDRY